MDVDGSDGPPPAALLDGVRRMAVAETEAAVYDSLVRLVAEDVLADRAKFVATVTREGVVSSLAPPGFERGELPRQAIEIGELCFDYGDPCVIDDVREVRATATVGAEAPEPEAVRSMLLVPLGGGRVLVAGAAGRGALTEGDLDVVTRIGEVARGVADGKPRSSAFPDALYGLLSHDIRSPLHAAKGWTEAALREDELGYLEDAEHALERIEEYLDSAAKIVETGLLVPSPEPVDLAESVERVGAMLDLEAVEIEIRESATIDADPTCLTQILDNLLRNAIQHGGGTLTVTVGLTDSGFYVEDDGRGIPPDRRTDVLDRGTSSRADHSGLGLSIVKRLAEGHGWDLEVEESPSGGARFVFSGVDVLDR